MYHSNIFNPHGSLDLQLPSMHWTKVKTQFFLACTQSLVMSFCCCDESEGSL